MHPIRLDTPRQLYEHSHQLAVHCLKCRIWRELAVSDFADWAVEDWPVRTIRFRCCQCGARGEPQVRPPVPKLDRLYPGIYSSP
jgi:hypothetical protein